MSSPFAPPYAFERQTLLDVLRGEWDGVPGPGPWRVTTDSRLAHAGRIFFALRGDRFDGHDYVADVLARENTGAVVAADHPVAREPLPDGAFRIAVRDPLASLGALAHWVRRTAEVPVIGLTGSAGKTTTREMIATILGRIGPGLATEGNLNNLVGVPLTLLRLEPGHRWLVIEMGMNAPGEIETLARITEPTIRLITNVAPAHLEKLGSLEGVARAKGELFAEAHPGDVLVSNADDPSSASFPRPDGTREIRFGESPHADVRLARIEPAGLDGSRIWLSIRGRERALELPLPGRHNAANAAAAVAVAWAAGVPPEAASALADVQPVGRRMAILRRGDVVLLDDCYNANPHSTAASLQTLVDARGEGRAIAVLGDMLELGEAAASLHEEVGHKAAALGVDRLMATGPLSRHTVDGARAAGMSAERATWFDGAEALVGRLAAELRPGDCVLIKGSRGARMERVTEGLEERLAC